MRRCLYVLMFLVHGVAVAQLGIKKEEWVEAPLMSIENGEIYVATHKDYPGDCLRTIFSIYWDIPTSQVISGEQEIQILTEKIIPAMQSRCPRMVRWDLSHFIKGKPLYDVVGDEIAFSGRWYFFHQGKLKPNLHSARAAWAFGSYDKAQAGVENGRRAQAESRRSGEESRARRQAAEESQRAGKCESESSNGTQPCGLILAKEFMKTANLIMPHCDKLLEHGWCTIDFGRTWVRWSGGTKHSCNPRKDKDDRDVLLCEFSAEWECKVRNMKTNEEVTTPVATGLLCAAFRPARMRAIAARDLDGWKVELLRQTAPGGLGEASHGQLVACNN